VAGELASHLCREDGNAPRSDAGWVRREINCTAGWSSAGRSWRWHRQSLAIRRSTDERRAQTRGASKRVRGLPNGRSGTTDGTFERNRGGSREDGNAPRSDAGWVRREINCTAGWSSAGRSWRWHRRSLAIRRSTDERRAQTRVTSKRVRVLQELRAGVERGRLFSWQRWAQTRVASKRVRVLSNGRAGAADGIFIAGAR